MAGFNYKIINQKRDTRLSRYLSTNKQIQIDQRQADNSRRPLIFHELTAYFFPRHNRDFKRIIRNSILSFITIIYCAWRQATLHTSAIMSLRNAISAWL